MTYKYTRLIRKDIAVDVMNVKIVKGRIAIVRTKPKNGQLNEDPRLLIAVRVLFVSYRSNGCPG